MRDFVGVVLVMFVAAQSAVAQGVPSLKRVAVPTPPNVSAYVRDQQALVVLGKALFWDLQLGSDGKTACASCHFHAGADHRIQNQLSNPLGSFPVNHTLSAADFPFRLLSNTGNNNSAVLRDSSQRTGSAGSFSRKLNALIPGLSTEESSDVADGIFGTAGLNVRRVTTRNAPSVINAVFNFRNFWDGRASEIFTGPTPFGLSDTGANVLSSASGTLQWETVRLSNSSLASQAVAPALNETEMSYGSRSWALVGKKMLALRPLAYQKIAPDDSVLGSFARPTGKGFQGSTTYLDLVKAAFQGGYWNGAAQQAEQNFWLFFGLSVQAYEATLVSDDSRLDRFADGQADALTNTEQNGMGRFTAECNNCHAGAEMTLATHSGVNGGSPLRAGRDTGYFVVGERPITDDVGLGGLDGFDKPLASVSPNPQGRFKAAGLRNVELTGPYFHDGGQGTLEQVVEFYNRGGNFPPNAGNGPGVKPLGLNANAKASIVAFLKAATDDRVRFERAPFDHPELCVANGHAERANGNPVSPLSAVDQWVGLAAVGRGGNSVPLQTFEELLSGVGSDGTRAHHMKDACGIEALTATGFVNANAASFMTSVVAQSSIVTAVGRNFAGAVNILDSTGVSHSAPISYASPAQINYVLPDGVAAGAATVSISGAAEAFQAQVLISAVSPGIFGVQGLAAANVVTVRDGVQTVTDAVRADLTLAPIELGPPDQQTYLILYGTGIRNHTESVTVTIGNASATALYAGAQGTFAGLDQVNVLIPATLKGAGIIDVTLAVDGMVTNAVKIRIQ